MGLHTIRRQCERHGGARWTGSNNKDIGIELLFFNHGVSLKCSFLEKHLCSAKHRDDAIQQSANKARFVLQG
jgi:hypothetical protein